MIDFNGTSLNKKGLKLKVSRTYLLNYMNYDLHPSKTGSGDLYRLPNMRIKDKVFRLMQGKIQQYQKFKI